MQSLLGKCHPQLTVQKFCLSQVSVIVKTSILSSSTKSVQMICSSQKTRLTDRTEPISMQETLVETTEVVWSNLCFGARFVARVKVKNRSIYSCLLAFWSGCVLFPWKRGWLKQGLKKWLYFISNKNPLVRLFSSFAHYELTLNPFCQYCSNKMLT